MQATACVDKLARGVDKSPPSNRWKCVCPDGFICKRLSHGSLRRVYATPRTAACFSPIGNIWISKRDLHVTRLLGTTCIIKTKREVCLHRFADAIALLNGGFALHLSRHTENERVGGNEHAFGTHGAGADDGTGADADPVQQDSAHGNEAIVLDDRTVDDGSMSDRDAAANLRRESSIGVDDRAVLDVAVVADLDRIAVA